MPGFDEYMKKAKPTSGEMIYVMMCMNGPKNTSLTGMKLHALLHALQCMRDAEGKQLPFKVYLEVNKYQPSGTLQNTYYPKWRAANKTFLEKAEQVSPGCVQTLDVFQDQEWEKIKEHYESYRNEESRKARQKTMLDEDEQKYIASHPGAENVRQHIIDVTVTLLRCHMQAGEDFAGMKNHLLYDGPLTNLQGNALQVAGDLGFQTRGLSHYRFSPDGLVTKFRQECPEEFERCLAAVKRDAAALVEEKAAAPDSPQASVVFHTAAPARGSLPDSMSMSPQLESVDGQEAPALLISDPVVTTSSTESTTTTSLKSPTRHSHISSLPTAGTPKKIKKGSKKKGDSMIVDGDVKEFATHAYNQKGRAEPAGEFYGAFYGAFKATYLRRLRELGLVEGKQQGPSPLYCVKEVEQPLSEEAKLLERVPSLASTPFVSPSTTTTTTGLSSSSGHAFFPPPGLPARRAQSCPSLSEDAAAPLTSPPLSSLRMRASQGGRGN